MPKTIGELEKETGESFEDIIREYFDTCMRTGHTNMREAAMWFINENGLRREETLRVISRLNEIKAENDFS